MKVFVIVCEVMEFVKVINFVYFEIVFFFVDDIYGCIYFLDWFFKKSSVYVCCVVDVMFFVIIVMN